MNTHPPDENDGRHDFDFIFGDWVIRNRKLHDVSDPDCTEWIAFDTTSHAEPILGGLANIERIVCGSHSPGGAWEGFTLRQFDPGQRRWRIWWASTKNPGRLDPPLSGRFHDGIGEFTGADTLAGRPIKVRFHWTIAASGKPRWTQAFSYDDGRTWQANWSMDFSIAGR
ncbi:MAG: hypothetical protein DLM57_06545 [Pseudonocardiales bacterium]|nr:MAG: hypothetical protein DLM57_06545 [Pseudonocardiales bacterium]